MELTEIWISIILPLLIGPICIFAKTVYDNYKMTKFEKMKIEFDEKLEKLRNKLDIFYWPVYLKLLCIYQLNYNIPDTEDEHESDNSSSSSSDDETKEDREYCEGYYMKAENDYYKCLNIIPSNSSTKICKKCRWKMAHSKINLKLVSLDKNECRRLSLANNQDFKDVASLKNATSIRNANRLRNKNTCDIKNIMDTDNFTDNSENISILITEKGKKKRKATYLSYRRKGKQKKKSAIKNNVIINIPDDVDIELGSSSSSDDDETKDNRKYNKIAHLNVIIDTETSLLLKNKLNEYYKGVIEIIQTNISIGEPNETLGREILKFIKYAKIREIIDEGSINQKYKSRQFGAKNNTDKLLSKIEFYLFHFKREYENLMARGPYL